MAGRAGRFVVNSASLFRFERLERFEPLERLGRPGGLLFELWHHRFREQPDVFQRLKRNQFFLST
jgi:hypothetical protein